jgi:hypothetical protein
MIYARAGKLLLWVERGYISGSEKSSNFGLDRVC